MRSHVAFIQKFRQEADQYGKKENTKGDEISER